MPISNDEFTLTDLCSANDKKNCKARRNDFYKPSRHELCTFFVYTFTVKGLQRRQYQRIKTLVF
jgi:hypothetical protein